MGQSKRDIEGRARSQSPTQVSRSMRQPVDRHHELVLALRMGTMHILGADSQDPQEVVEDH